jgi:hypothetical protein
MLRSFKHVCEPHSVFLTSVTLARPWQSNYDGDAWVGRSHTSDKAGIVRYTRRWLKDRARQHGCKLTVGDKVLDQTWLKITPASEARNRRRQNPPVHDPSRAGRAVARIAFTRA